MNSTAVYIADIADHDGEADDCDTEQVDHHERGTTSLPDLGRESPDVAEPHGRAGGCQNETRPRAPGTASSCHVRSFLDVEETRHFNETRGRRPNLK